MKMLFGNVNVGGTDAAFQVLPKVFHPVDVRVSDNIFMDAVIDRLVIVASLFQSLIGVQFVSMNRCSSFDILFNDWLERLPFAVRHNLRHYLSLALHHPKDNRLIGRTATTHAGAITADIGFINLNIAKQWKLAVNKLHVFADKVCHAPSRLVSHAKLTFQFLRRNAVAGSCEKVNRIEPKLQRCAAVLKRRADCGMQMMAAPLAGVSAFSLKTKPLRFLVALRADVALAKANIKQVIQAGFVGRKLRQKFPNCQTGLRLFFSWRSFHAPNIRPNHYLCQGDNSVIELL